MRPLVAGCPTYRVRTMNQARSNGGLLDGYLTPAETATELGVSVRTLERWHLLRKGPPRTELGKRIYYRRDAVRAWMRGQELPHPPAGRRPTSTAHSNRNSRPQGRGGASHA